jgi:hypothetical protein
MPASLHRRKVEVDEGGREGEREGGRPRGSKGKDGSDHVLPTMLHARTETRTWLSYT